MKSFLWIFLGLLLPFAVLANNPPVVTNVTAQQQSGSQLVRVTYDVTDADNDTMTISLQISSDAGATWTVPVRTVGGNVGNGVISGTNYEIMWDAGEDYAEHEGTEYKAKIIANDNAPRSEVMVFVPAGTYSIGSESIPEIAVPVHNVTLLAFYIDMFEVTNAQYKAFCDATSREYPPDPSFPLMPNYSTNPAFRNYPVVNVYWDDAEAYAVWKGRRLPTEAEWEAAAKGNVAPHAFPWGDQFADSCANVMGNLDGYERVAPVGSFPAGVSWVGCHDMAGNVYEMVEDDWHNNYVGAPTNTNPWIDNPRANMRVMRGGSWSDTSMVAQCAWRSSIMHPMGYFNFVGFRCAKHQYQ